MYYPVCGIVHIKDPLLLIGKSSPLNGGSGFPLSLSPSRCLSGPLPYLRRHIIIIIIITIFNFLLLLLFFFFLFVIYFIFKKIHRKIYTYRRKRVTKSTRLSLNTIDTHALIS